MVDSSSETAAPRSHKLHYAAKRLPGEGCHTHLPQYPVAVPTHLLHFADQASEGAQCALDRQPSQIEPSRKSSGLPEGAPSHLSVESSYGRS